MVTKHNTRWLGAPGFELTTLFYQHVIIPTSSVSAIATFRSLHYLLVHSCIHGLSLHLLHALLPLYVCPSIGMTELLDLCMRAQIPLPVLLLLASCAPRAHLAVCADGATAASSSSSSSWTSWSMCQSTSRKASTEQGNARGPCAA